MKSVVSSLSLFLIVLLLVVTISRHPLGAQAIIPTPDSPDTISIAERNMLLAKAVAPSKAETALDEENLTEAVPLLDQTWEKQYQDFFRVNFSARTRKAKDIADTLSRIAVQTGKKPALIQVLPRQKQLELVLTTPGSKPIHKRVTEAKRTVLLQKARQFTDALTIPYLRNTTSYLPAAQQLYQWMIAPLEADLKTKSIDTLIFCTGAGLRTLPLAALHDGQQFLVEKYSIGSMPAFKLTNTVYADIRNSQVLAMGASEFRDQAPLPAVPVELSEITKDLWRGKSFLNQEFTPTNLQSQLQQQPFKIIHLATHADFQPGAPSNSYVQFWNTKLGLDKMRQLDWNERSVELLVLSACRTAIGDKSAELGFAGLAVQSGVKSALASLWHVSDEGTLGLMTEFYRQLHTAPIKAEAVRQAQIAMLKGQVRLQNGQLQTTRGNVSLPPELAALGNKNLSHPYNWAAFALVGSPW